jgi:hypothetical protein
VPLLASLLALTGCATVLGIDDGQPLSDASANLSSPDAGRDAQAGPDGAARPDGGPEDDASDATSGTPGSADADASEDVIAAGDSSDAPVDVATIDTGVGDATPDTGGNAGDAAPEAASCVPLTGACTSDTTCCSGYCGGSGKCVGSCTKAGQGSVTGCIFTSCCYGLTCSALVGCQ